jgi:electron transfer flavoprotein alpha/beta subunit
MLWHKAKAMGWAGAIFAGRKKRSPLEIDLGIEVTLIQVTEMLLVPESQAIVDAEAKGEVMAEIAHDLMDQFDGLMYEDALRMAQTTQGTIVQTITTVDGKSLPKTLEVLAIGSEGNVAIGARRGGR